MSRLLDRLRHPWPRPAICIICGATMQARTSLRVYCSHRCAQRAYRRRQLTQGQPAMLPADFGREFEALARGRT